MKSLFALLSAALLTLALPARGASLFQNFLTLDFPSADPIDATTVENYGTINVSGTSILFDTQNTLNFVNQGTIDAFPGVRFDFVQGYTRLPMIGFTNLGSVFATENLLVSATNLVNVNGLLSATRSGRVHLEGQNIDLSNSRVRAGNASDRFNGSEGGLFSGSARTYFNPGNVVDEYWGVTGTNTGRLSLPFMQTGGQSPSEQVILRGGTSTTASVGLSGYSFFWTSQFVRINANTVRATVQMVFVQTNLVENPAVRVYFTGGTNSNNFIFTRPLVELSMSDFDPVSGGDFTRSFWFLDDSAVRVRANVNSLQSPVLFQNGDHPGLFRSEAHGLFWTDSAFSPGFETAPEAWDPNLMFTTSAANTNGRYETNSVDHEYSATRFSILARDVGGATITDVAGATGLSDPTNSPGRIEILANQLDLRFSQMRAENLISIRATNAVDLTGFSVDAQNVNLEVMGTGGSVAISNSFPAVVNRLHGTISAWSGVWQVDQFITNQVPVTDPFQQVGNWLASSNTVQYTYHVLVLDNQTSTNQAVGFENFRIASSNLVLSDSVTINKSFYFGGERLFLPTNGSILISGTNHDLTAVNLPFVNYFTNQGSIYVPQAANFGYFDRPAPYSNIVNNGTISSGSLFFRSAEFQNTSNLFANNGSLRIDAGTNRLDGGLLYSSSSVSLSGNELYVNGTNPPFGSFYGSLYAAGSLTLNLTNRLTDSNLTNQWVVNGGFSMTTKPIKGDLLSTRITSIAAANRSAVHYWTADDRGDTFSGYANNAAVGELVLDGATGSHFYFRPVPGQINAMYIDTLTLLNNATNFSTTLTVDPGLTIYFANANVPGDKLTNAYPGRLVWVSAGTRAGPLVAVKSSIARSTTMTTQDYQALLASSPDVDGDGIPNELDETPFSGFTISSVSIIDWTGGQKMALISWQALAGSTYTLEARDGLNAAWRDVITQTALATGMCTLGDLVPAGGQRFYRVRYGQ